VNPFRFDGCKVVRSCWEIAFSTLPSGNCFFKTDVPSPPIGPVIASTAFSTAFASCWTTWRRKESSFVTEETPSHTSPVDSSVMTGPSDFPLHGLGLESSPQQPETFHPPEERNIIAIIREILTFIFSPEINWLG